MKPLLLTRERRANSIFPETGTEIFEASTDSQEAGTRREKPVPVCLISHALSTSSEGVEVEFQKHPTNKNGIKIQAIIRKIFFIDFTKKGYREPRVLRGKI